MSITTAFAVAQPVVKSQKVIGGSSYDELRSLFVTKDGGLIAAGQSYSNKSGEKTQNIRGANDYWVVKLDKHHKIQWDRTIGGIGSDNFKSIIETSDGGYALIGESSSFTSVEKDEDSRAGSSDFWFVKLDNKGNVEWNKTIGGAGTEFVDNIVQTKDGGYVLMGSSDSYTSFEKSEDSHGTFDYWVVRLDKKGNILWDKTLGGTDFEFGSPIELTSDGGMLVGGFSNSNISFEKTENSRGDYDYWVVKLDKNGKVQWDKTIGGSGGDFCRGIQQTSNGGYVLAGFSNSNISGEKSENSRGGMDYWIVKLNSDGQLKKEKTIGGDGDDSDIWNLEKTKDGGFVFGSRSASGKSGEKTEDSRGDYDYWVVKIDKDLNLHWDKTIGGAAYDALFSIREVEENEYVMGGVSWSEVSGDKTEPSRGLADYWIVWLSDRKKNDHHHDGDWHSSVLTNGNSLRAQERAKIFAVYPNPVNDLLNIQVTGKATLTLTDQSGKILIAKTINTNGSISLAALPKGIYFLKNNETSEVKKVMKTK